MSDQNKIYITTPIYYVNDKPHIGHAYTTIAADVLSRYYKSQEKEVFFLTGVDEHGAKITEAAKEAGKEPKEFVDELAPHFSDAWKNLEIEYSEFFRTTNPEHEKIVQEFVQKLVKAGYIEKKKYEGLYCVGCEKYLTLNDLVNGKCPDHKTEPIKQSEENWFFLLEKAVNDSNLLQKIESGEFKVKPDSRRNEVIGKIKQGLEDVSISREKVEWGIKFPGDDTQTIYVWIDALINYYSATKIYQIPDWEEHPADLHLMAKDILWFHAIIWPAMLSVLSLPLPKEVFAHGFFTINGQKMSKSVGNVIDPNEMVKKYGADAVRYALLREFPFGEDGDISEEKIALRYKNDLGNELGNLLNRTINMINKYDLKPQNSNLKTTLKNLKTVEVLIEEKKFDAALIEIWKGIKEQNQYIDKEKPWELAKNNPEKLPEVLLNIYSFLSSLVPVISCFMPETAEKMKNQLETLKPEPLFPRIN